MALSRLEAARGPTSDAAAQLDQLLLARASQATSDTDLRTLQAAVSEVDAILAGQQGVIESLRR